ncbi:MAG: hypothetical protein IJ520_02720 [Synergistaceae bacterium]|nr:hypothetical protein [Synergistaceae bacterium]
MKDAKKVNKYCGFAVQWHRLLRCWTVVCYSSGKKQGWCMYKPCKPEVRAIDPSVICQYGWPEFKTRDEAQVWLDKAAEICGWHEIILE